MQPCGPLRGQRVPPRSCLAERGREFLGGGGAPPPHLPEKPSPPPAISFGKRVKTKQGEGLGWGSEGSRTCLASWSGSPSMSTVDEVKERIHIVEVVAETVKLRKSGKNYAGFCPFHPNTRTPAF